MNQLKSTRLALRQIEQTDWDVYLKLNTTKVILKFHYEAGRMKSLNQIKLDFKELIEQSAVNRKEQFWVIFKLESKEMIGICSMPYVEHDNEWHVGFRLLDEEWNKGYGTEVLGELVKIGKTKGIEKLNAVVNVGNVASEKILLRHSFTLTQKGIFYNDWNMNKFELIL